MKAFFAGICLFFSTLVSCQQKGEDFESVSTDEFATLIADPDIQRLDVRTVAEYSEEHIPGSININVLDEQFTVIADSTLQKDKPIALYCRSGKRSKKAATILSRKGYKVYDLDKGFIGWKEAGELITSAMECCFSQGLATDDLARLMPDGKSLSTSSFRDVLIQQINCESKK